MFWNKNKVRYIDAPKYAFTHRNLPESEKYLKSLVSFILASRDNWVSCNQTLGCLRLYGDSRVSRAQPRINAYEILLQHDWLLFFSRYNRFAETHSHLQLSYHIHVTDRLLAAGWHLNVECFESAVPAIFPSYAPTSFQTYINITTGKGIIIFWSSLLSWLEFSSFVLWHSLLNFKKNNNNTQKWVHGKHEKGHLLNTNDNK